MIDRSTSEIYNCAGRCVSPSSFGNVARDYPRFIENCNCWRYGKLRLARSAFQRQKLHKPLVPKLTSTRNSMREYLGSDLTK